MSVRRRKVRKRIYRWSHLRRSSRRSSELERRTRKRVAVPRLSWVRSVSRIILTMYIIIFLLFTEYWRRIKWYILCAKPNVPGESWLIVTVHVVCERVQIRCTRKRTRDHSSNFESSLSRPVTRASSRDRSSLTLGLRSICCSALWELFHSWEYFPFHRNWVTQASFYLGYSLKY